MVSLKRIHHVAYRCNDAKETALFYKKMLGMDLTVSISESHVPSTGEPDPYMHIFLDAGQGNVLAFFELTGQKPMGRDENTPTWVQHIALEVGSLDELEKAKKHLEDNGLDVLGITNHGVFKSLYFFDPNGHRIELAANTGTDEQMKKLKDIAWDMLDEWAETKQPPKHTNWLHDEEFLDKGLK
ncbi:MAG: glyoxalase [Halobacteriovoraceae bacterium]|nr:glyoxalase [Halobacteriovoraceae bacterium]|tara:strand:- start:22083 stop:22634 length:552 start_codon:yes stop_codon:yes gene_type:complete